jgi:hypothetical protein
MREIALGTAAVLSLVTLGNASVRNEHGVVGEMRVRATAMANLWIDRNGGSCLRSARPAAYSDAAACANFNAAWQAASAGDTVRVQAGNYGNQFFNSHSPAMTARGVTFRATGGTVTVGKLDIGDDSGNFGSGRGRQDEDRLTFVGPVTATGTTLLRHTRNVTFDGWTWNQGFAARKSVFWLGDTDRTTIRNSDLCCSTDYQIMESTVPSPNFGPNSNITIEYTKIHSMRRTSTGVHTECFLAPAVPGLTLRGTHWWGCNVMNINIGAFGDSAPYQQSNFHWVNNIFESPTNLTATDKTGYPFFQGCNQPSWGTKPGWVVEYNLFETPWYTPAACGDAGLTLRGNIGSTGLKCPVGATYSKNIWRERACGATDIQVPTILSGLNFTNILAHDWTYAAGAFQIDKGDPASYPPYDAAGRPRPIRISVAVSKSATSIRVSGKVSPLRPKRRMVVAVSQRRRGVARKLVLKRPLLSSLSTFSTSFKRVSQGTCTVTVRVVGATTIGRADAGPYEYPGKKRRSALVAFRC